MLDEILSPLILQGQPLSHICNTHRDEIKVSERSIYNYIEAGELSIGNLDLRRKVKYRRRRKKTTEIKCNKFSYRQGRTYEDFQRYMDEHPDTPVVEMDTIRGKIPKEQVVLTIMFNHTSVMLMILIEDESILRLMRLALRHASRRVHFLLADYSQMYNRSFDRKLQISAKISYISLT